MHILNKHLFILAGLLVLWSTNVSSDELYFVDAHSQADGTIPLKEILVLMNKAGVKKTILSSRRKSNPFDIADFAEHHPDKIIAAVRTKSQQYTHNTNKYYKLLSKQLNDSRFHAMAELLLYHAQKGNRAGKIEVYPNDKRVLTALKGAKKHGWPFVMHIEFASMTGIQRQKYMRELDNLFTQNKGYPFALIHMGQLGPSDVKKLIVKYSNLYFITSNSNNIAVARSNQPWVNLFKGNTLDPQWRSLILTYPRRFIFAIDNVWPEQWRNGYKEQVQLWRYALNILPENVANAIAHDNAERLWKLH